MEANGSLTDGDEIRELFLQRRNRRDRDETGRFKQSPKRLSREIGAYLKVYGVGQIDRLAEEFGRSEVDVRRGIYALRHEDNLNGIRTVQTYGGSGIYYLDDRDRTGLLIKNSDGLKKMGIDPAEVVGSKPIGRLRAMTRLGVVQSGSMLSDTLHGLAEGPKTSRDLSKVLKKDCVNFAEMLRGNVEEKLRLFGLRVRREPVGKEYGVGRLQALYLEGTPVQWEPIRRLESFFHDHHDRLVRFTLSRIGDVALAEEIVQSLHERLLRMVKEDPESVSKINLSYIFTALKNRVSNHYRDNRKFIYPDEDTEFEDKKTSVLTSVEKEEMKAHIKGLLQNERLNNHREVLELFYFEEMSTIMIAELLGMPEGTVQSKLSRGRQILKRLLEPYVD